ncbi:hypothetical protein [Streptomyces sp. IGB124]|nr:hypothetical protein [Streptomyces sp. IGB124]
MALHRPMAHTNPHLIVVDNTGSHWVLSLTARHDGTPYKITSFHPDR